MSTEWIAEELARLEASDLRRHPVTLSSAQEPEVLLDGRRVVLLCSNNYLGLAADARVRRASADAALRWGAGAGASRLVSGTTDLHRRLEEALAALKRAADCVLFSSGYLANVGTVSTLVARGDAVFSDELNHASIIDGCRVSGARKEIYGHADAADLDRLLGRTTARRRLVVTDTVFSMDGDLAPLGALAEVCARHDAMLMVDEAHATGLLGPGGAGAVAAAGLEGRVPVVMGTLSKSLGSAGGFVCGDRDLVDLLRNRARTHVFDTAPAPASVGAALAALRISCADPALRDRALRLARLLAGELRALGFEVLEPAAAVVPVMVGEAREALDLSRRLLERGVFVPAIRPPTVPTGTARLRVTAMASHTDEHIERTLEAFGRRPARRVARARGLFVTGTDTGVGKTVVTAMVARALRMNGRSVAVLKAVQTGEDDDAGFVAACSGVRALAAVRLREPLAPAVAARLAGDPVDVEHIVRAYEALARDADVVLVEGAGGLLVPLTDDATMADLAARLGHPVVVVARPSLGTINHTVLTVRAAHAHGLEVAGVVLSGFPDEPGLAEATNPAEIERLAGVPIAGVLPVVDPTDLSLDPRAFLAQALGGCFDRAAFLADLSDLSHRRAHVARA